MRVLLAALLAFVLDTIKGLGAAEERARQQADTDRDIATTQAAREEVAGLSDDQVDAELERWTGKARR